MVRVGTFEVEFVFQSLLSIAEVYNGRAPLLRFAHVRNIRGSEADWLKITAVISGHITKQKSIRHLPVHDESKAICYENELLSDLLLPSNLLPGKHEGEIRIAFPDGEKHIPFSLNILSASWIPTDLAHSPYLSSWIHAEDDTLRGFATEIFGELGPDQPIRCMQMLYEKLSQRKLMYQPVVSTLYPDFQPISDYSYIMNKGGSCMDLSLLTASLLWIRGLSPALLLYNKHITTGCFSAGKLPDFDLLENPKQIADMIYHHQLCLPEITGICSHQHLSFAESLNQALDQLENTSSGCSLVNIKTILRQGKAKLLPISFQRAPVQCPNCGFDHIVVPESEEDICCPACRQTFKPGTKSTPAIDIVPEIIYEPGVIHYECKEEKAGVVRCQRDLADVIQILPRWQNLPVTYIESHAFENSMLRGISLPDSITEIKDRAFRGCENMLSVQLPPDLSRLGSGAFSSSGLQSIRIPGSVLRIPVLCFSNCTQLETVTIENGVQEIDSQAFIHCPNLKYVYLPSSVRKISKTAFDSSCQLVLASAQTKLV